MSKGGRMTNKDWEILDKFIEVFDSGQGAITLRMKADGQLTKYPDI